MLLYRNTIVGIFVSITDNKTLDHLTSLNGNKIWNESFFNFTDKVLIIYLF